MVDNAIEAKFLELRRQVLKDAMDQGLAMGLSSNTRVPDDYWSHVMHLRCGRPDAQDLLDPNPASASSTRLGGSKVWDQALYIPKDRQPKLLHPRDVRGTSRINTTWMNHTLPRFRMLPFPHGEGEVVTVEDPNIIDFLSDNPAASWFDQEAAHVLTHHRSGDSLKDMPHVQAEFGIGSDLGPYAPQYRQALAEILVAQRYNLGLDLRGREQLGRRESTIECGVEVATTVYLGSPLLMIERKGNRRLRFDGVGAIVLVGLATGNLPTEYLVDLPIHARTDAWVGRPTVVTFIGWCTPDMLYRGDVAALGPVRRDTVTYSAVHADDLFPIGTFPGYLAMVQSGSTFPRGGQQFTHVPAWMNSSEFASAFSETMPWPCEECMSIDARIDGAPVRPKVFPRTKRELQAHPEWKRFRCDKRRLMKIVKSGVRAFEAEIYGAGTDVTTVRENRLAGSRRRCDRLADARLEADIKHRNRNGKDLTKEQGAHIRAKRRASRLAAAGNGN